tara:strand:+ start:605 stop:1465 length:861 start_codon:yes stop_codon:yes gene_type:complete
MTGFARVEGASDAGRLTVEVRSVNHRYLEPTLRLPDRLRAFETDLRGQLKQRLQRGKVDCYLRLEETSSSVGFSVNDAAVTALAGAIDKVRGAVPDAAPANPIDILRWPGLLDTPVAEEEALQRDVNATFAKALDGLIATRESEGATLEGYVLERLTVVEAIVAEGRAIAGQIAERLRERLRQRLAKLQVDNLDEGRLEQEVAVLAQKADVDEELDRLTTHIDEIRTTFRDSGKGAIGRRLDFLMQELNREANTLAAKATQTETTLQAVELKLLVEQMREQIQNIE